MSQKYLKFVAASVLTLATVTGARAAIIASYRADFTTSGPTHAGWSYLWNANGPIGNAANYVPLVRDTNYGGDFETVANGSLPDAAPGAGLAATSDSLFPGQGTAQAGDGIERWAIAAYTISAADVIAAAGGNTFMPTYSFEVAADSLDGVNARIYVNNTLFNDSPLAAGDVFNQSLFGGYPVPLSNPGEPLVAGDTIYVAIGGKATDTLDRVYLDYTIEVPEPASLGLLCLAGLALRRRR